MNAEQKVVQYLNEAHAQEVGLTRVLQAQTAMTPRGDYRSELERHLEETREQARRIAQRLGELGEGGPSATLGRLGDEREPGWRAEHRIRSPDRFHGRAYMRREPDVTR